MQKPLFAFEQFAIAKNLLRWTILIVPVAIVIGSLVALFLWLLEWATQTRWENMWLIFLLPVAGLFIFFLYQVLGKNAAAGNNLIIDEIYTPASGIPTRMAPLILITTVVTHLFGGSAGREGTAVQIGGSIADRFSRWYNLQQDDKRILLMAGMAAGFGAVFGTPITGAIFALEVLAVGRIKYDALVPCLIASVVADITCTKWGAHHTHYIMQSIESTDRLISFFPVDVWMLVKVIGAGAIFGLVSFLFVRLTTRYSHVYFKHSLVFVSFIIKTHLLIP